MLSDKINKAQRLVRTLRPLAFSSTLEFSGRRKPLRWRSAPQCGGRASPASVAVC